MTIISLFMIYYNEDLLPPTVTCMSSGGLRSTFLSSHTDLDEW